MAFSFTRKLIKKIIKHTRKAKRCYELPHIHHSHSSEYDLHASTISIRSVYRPKLERAGSDASEISEYVKEKCKDVLLESGENEWTVIPSYEKGIRESYLLPMNNDKIDQFLLHLEEALTSDQETPPMGIQPAFIFLRPGSRRVSAGVDIILAKDCTLARSPGCLYLSFNSAPVTELVGKRGGLFRSWTM